MKYNLECGVNNKSKRLSLSTGGFYPLALMYQTNAMLHRCRGGYHPPEPWNQTNDICTTLVQNKTQCYTVVWEDTILPCICLNKRNKHRTALLFWGGFYINFHFSSLERQERVPDLLLLSGLLITLIPVLFGAKNHAMSDSRRCKNEQFRR
jgi:hypothetical protein